ncbi:MAG: hypothetical protein AAF329_28365 [Cyanobacteria bacterium P01_A01_bin.17]
MFNQLSNFRYQRTAVQAIGFYIAYFLLLVISGGLAGAMTAMIFPGDPAQLGIRAGFTIAILGCSGLAITIASQKRILNNFLTWILIALTVLLSILLGGIGGLLPVAYLSTKPSKT